MTSEKREPEASERRLTRVEAVAKAIYDHAVKSAVKSIEENKIDYQLIRSVEQNIERESDRSCAIIIFSLIDELMQGLILAECEASVPRLKDRLFDPQSGMLPNTAKRIFFAMALKWISKETFHTLNILRKVRNEFAHTIACDRFDHVKIRGLLSSIASVNKDGFVAALEVALDGLGIPEKFDDALAEYSKKERFFFLVECALTMDRLVREMAVFPEVQRWRIDSGDVVNRYDNLPGIPSNLRGMSHAAMSLMLRAVESTFDSGVKIETSGPGADEEFR
jgi:hypothetical protein